MLIQNILSFCNSLPDVTNLAASISAQSVCIATSVVAGTGLLIGLFLGFAAKTFAVEVDDREIKVRELLPGANCGGCGFAGCDAAAKAIAEGKAPVNTCPVANQAAYDQIAAVMGEEAAVTEKKTAFVKCSGTCDKTEVKYEYYGIHDCNKAAQVPGKGNKKCSYGCMGYGSCVSACSFDAIHIVNGIAEVDSEKCTGCSSCTAVCPNHLIELVPVKAKQLVACNSRDKGKDVKAACSAGCIGCRICEKSCEYGAITVEDNLAHIDYDKCTGCGKCVEKCPVKIIRIKRV